MDELRLTLVSDRTQTRGRELVTVVGDCLGAGLRAVQVREKDLGAADLAFLCRRIRVLTLDAQALLIVNDRLDVALAVGADGVQRTSTSLDVEDIRRVAGPALRVGASVHSLPEALDAEAKGADFLVFGPIYETPSKRPYGPPQGLDRLAKLAAGVRRPVVAIGGITPARVRDVRLAGAFGVAAISAILDTDAPADATRRFLDALAAA
ncbi:MAG: thiamine-phosphate diphosphorylase [Candidatus Rokubacteria bacterium RIFCSPLOWO2_02_FULL_73_56]|nr:MAG: thiamine-phosphate diphosphorylase [Candidatus Rokubacteria bacterium RIFCSPHIGHO2_02_FULL_73_26]OGL10157.1 MAG: thiamine-phosphate diphosphorylase [Candidatus Rokubacteria bacterium RIFCSPLOWO2_02_FULL_73_56]OGL29913.1 MAG: thiamine-phosphate diphosphorylase [Candidatus Rokubacteria bacterium RIFCSPLOWO2_12_FULL_73_47]